MALPPPNFSRRNASAYVPDLAGVSDMQRRFCEEYLIDLNPRAAAIRAGYAPDKAQYAASQVMRHPPCRDLIAHMMAQRSARVGLNADRVLDRLGAIVMGDPRNCFRPDGSIKPPSELNKDDALLIAGVKTRRIVGLNEEGKIQPEEITEVKVVDSLAALTLAMRHLGLLNEKLDINVTHTLAERLNAAHKRIADKGKDGPTIDGEFVEDVAHALEELERDAYETQNRIVHEAVNNNNNTPLPLSWDDVI